MAERRIPLALKVAYTLWFAVWAPTIWIDTGAANFLWLCDIANFLILIAIWRESALLFSSQTVSVLLIQVSWMVDFFGRMALGFHPLGGTDYMFEAAKPLWIRGLSLFHVVIPVLLLWAIWRLGFDTRGWKLQTVIAWIVLPLSLFPDPERNINWIWGPFGLEQTLMPVGLYVVVCMVAYPLVLYLPTHALLQWWIRRSGRPLLPA